MKPEEEQNKGCCKNMFTRITLSALAGISLTSSIVSAETAASSFVDGTIHFAVGSGTLGDDFFDADARSLKFSLEGNVHLSEQFKIGIDVSHSKLTISDAMDFDVDIKSTRLNIMPTYSFGNGAYAGLYLQDNNLAVFNSSLDLESYGAFVGYSGDKFSLEGYTGKTSLNAVFGPSGSVGASNVGVIGTLQPAENLHIFAHYSLANIDDIVGLGGDVSIAAVGAEYGFGSGWAMFAAFSSSEIDSSADPIRQTSLGVSYDLALSGIPGVIALDWSRTDYGFGGVEQSMVSLGWTIPLGGAAAAPQTCTMNNARGKNRAALAATFECAPGLFGGPA